MEKVNYPKSVEKDLVGERVEFKLGLRKQKIEDYFMAKRFAEMKLRNSTYNSLEVNPDILMLSNEIRNKEFVDMVNFFNLE
jgi:hypothetical protein